MADHGAIELQLATQAVEKGDRLPPRLDEGQRYRWIDDVEGNPWNPGAGTDVDDLELRTPRQERPEEQRVEEEASTNAGDRAQPGQVVRSIPKEKQICVALESLALSVGGAPLEQGRERAEERF